MSSFVDQAVESVRATVGRERVLCALSGGVDSAVTAALVHRAIGDQLQCVFVDNGLLRKGEGDAVRRTFQDRFGMRLLYVDAAARFLERLRGVTDPEQKRKLIGAEFIAVFQEEAERLGTIPFLAQGTLYPDVIESTSFRGPSATIKTHHNVGRAAEGPPVHPGGALARALQGRGAGPRRAARASPRRSSGASRSRGPGWPCASWGR